MTRHDLEDRLTRFAESILQLAEQLPNTKAGNQLQGRIIKFSSAAVTHYAKKLHERSRKDFIRKLKQVLKALRDTEAGLKLINIEEVAEATDMVHAVLKESGELIAIFVTSIRTATQNDALARRFKRSGV